MWDTITQIAPYAVAYTIPLLMGSLSGLVSERSGVVNLCVEGYMLVGYFFSALAISILQPVMGNWALLVGLIVAMIGGAIFSLLHGFASISLKADQVISGTAVNLIAAALTVYIARNVTGSGNISIMLGIVRSDVPLLHSIPILGKLLFTNTYWSTWLCLGIWAFFWWLLYKTSFGLRLRACGEHPSAVASAGINVHKMRYIAVMLSGALGALAGGVMIVTYSGEFNGSVAGLGFLAVAAMIFGQWKPLGILGATFFFGIATTIGNVSQLFASLSSFPPVLFKIFPYTVTLIALVLFSKSSAAPKADGEPF